jgi:hypothetical protein
MLGAQTEAGRYLPPGFFLARMEFAHSLRETVLPEAI